MAVTDISSVLSTARWADEAYYLKEFVHKFKLPQVAKVSTMQLIEIPRFLTIDLIIHAMTDF